MLLQERYGGLQHFDKQLAEISSRCPKVRWLRLDCLRSDVLWDNSLVTLTQSFQMLTELTLSKVVNLSAGGLIAALSHCKCRESLHIKTRNQRIPVEVAIPTLKSITIMSVHMHDAVLLAISQKCSKLETLLFFQWKAGNGDLVTDVGVRAVLEGCPLLRETDVEYASSISPELRVELARRRDSTRIAFAQWIGMTDELAQGLLTVCPNLTELHCTFCGWLTDATLLVCAQHCPPLKVFKFWNCPLVTSDGVRAVVAKAADRLRIVKMRFVPETLDAAMAIAEHCPLLERFDAEPMVSNAAAARLAQRCVRLRRKPTGRTTALLVKLRPWILRVLFLIALAVVSRRERCEHLIVAMMPAWYMIQ
jgi:F-box/leucine-rich repeat protein 2/20